MRKRRWPAWGIRTTWIAVVLSLLPVVVVTDPSCYCFSLFMIAALLERTRRSLEVATLGVAAVGQFLVLQLHASELPYVFLAGLYVTFATILVSMFARPPWQLRRHRVRGNRPPSPARCRSSGWSH